jgi:hypothetical protein
MQLTQVDGHLLHATQLSFLPLTQAYKYTKKIHPKGLCFAMFAFRDFYNQTAPETVSYRPWLCRVRFLPVVKSRLLTSRMTLFNG